ncbi:hypothetical protein EE612_011999, partial [Oryza sativa]
LNFIWECIVDETDLGHVIDELVGDADVVGAAGLGDAEHGGGEVEVEVLGLEAHVEQHVLPRHGLQHGPQRAHPLRRLPDARRGLLGGQPGLEEPLPDVRPRAPPRHRPGPRRRGRHRGRLRRHGRGRRRGAPRRQRRRRSQRRRRGDRERVADCGPPRWCLSPAAAAARRQRASRRTRRRWRARG